MAALADLVLRHLDETFIDPKIPCDCPLQMGFERRSQLQHWRAAIGLRAPRGRNLSRGAFYVLRSEYFEMFWTLKSLKAEPHPSHSQPFSWSLQAFAEDVLEERRAKAAMAEEATRRIAVSTHLIPLWNMMKYDELCRVL